MAAITFDQAIPFTQNNRQCWVTKLPISQILSLTLPDHHGQQLNLFHITNREIEQPHANELAKYLTTPNWALPSIILAAPQGAAKANAKKELTADTGNLKILDGQHRIQAMLDLARDGHENQAELLEQEIAITIIEVKDPADQANIWLDFAKNKPITGAWRDAVDNAKPFVRAAKLAIEKSNILKNRTLIGKTKIKSHRDTELLSLTDLKTITATTALGIRRAPSPKNQTAYESAERQETLKDRLVHFFDEFLPACRPNYDLLAEPQSIGQHIIFQRTHTCAYDAPILNLLAEIHARWAESQRDEKRLAEYLGKISLNKADPDNRLARLGLYDTAKENYEPAAKKHLWAQAAAAIREDAYGE